MSEWQTPQKWMSLRISLGLGVLAFELVGFEAGEGICGGLAERWGHGVAPGSEQMVELVIRVQAVKRMAMAEDRVTVPWPSASDAGLLLRVRGRYLRVSSVSMAPTWDCGGTTFFVKLNRLKTRSRGYTLNYFRCAALLALFCLLGGGTTVLADTITFANTGIAADGSLLVAGTADPNYTLVYSSDSGSTTAMATAPNGAWVPDTSTAGWISPGADGNESWNSGYYVYETTLDLTGYDASTAVLSGMIAVDDLFYIYLNRGGNAVASGSGFASLTPFVINSGFVSGLNQLDFVVVNQSGPSGLMVDDTLATADAQTPEPGGLLLLGTGMAVGALQIIRRHRSMMR